MNKYIFVRGSIAVIIGILLLLAFSGLFYSIKVFDVQLIALWQRILVDFSVITVVLLCGLIIITLLFGRIYCSTLCPLGLAQELLMLVFRRKVAVQPNRSYKYVLAAIVLGSLFGGTAYLVRLIDPYTIFGSFVSGAWFGLIFIIILGILVWFKGRSFCANVCPVGTVLGLISKHAINQIYMEKECCVSCGLCANKCPTRSIDFKNKIVDNETCIKCFSCLGGCRRGGLHYGVKPVEKVPFDLSRRKLLVSSAVVAIFTVAIKGGLELSKNIAAKIKKAILPAGAGSAGEFANRCLNCNLCVQNCPMKVLKKADEDYPAVHIDYKESFCDYNCNKCSQVCPSGAIKRLSLAEKQRTKIGVAAVDNEICVRCGLCVGKCPRQIIKIEVGSYPEINKQECIGCGACQNVCPVKAITVSAVEVQKVL